MPATHLSCTLVFPPPMLQAVDSSKEREELFEDWVEEKEKEVRRLFSLIQLK